MTVSKTEKEAEHMKPLAPWRQIYHIKYICLNKFKLIVEIKGFKLTLDLFIYSLSLIIFTHYLLPQWKASPATNNEADLK